MKVCFLPILFACIFASEMLVTKEYVEYLKKHVTWEVAEYESNIFKGWTMDEAKAFLSHPDTEEIAGIPLAEIKPNLPSTLSWANSACDHGVRNQGGCGAAWAFTIAGMLSDRCCIQGNDHGWLSAQELVSCAAQNRGCSGGYANWALDYVISAAGLVHDGCFQYKARDYPCQRSCEDGRDWQASHVCTCVGGYKFCRTVDGIKSCLYNGPVAVAFGVCRSFYNYRSGIYQCDCGGAWIGYQNALIMGYSMTPSPFFYVRNSWGSQWGNNGYFSIGLEECQIADNVVNGNLSCDRLNP